MESLTLSFVAVSGPFVMRALIILGRHDELRPIVGQYDLIRPLLLVWVWVYGLV